MELIKEIEALRESVRIRIIHSKTDPTTLIDIINDIDAILDRNR